MLASTRARSPLAASTHPRRTSRSSRCSERRTAVSAPARSAGTRGGAGGRDVRVGDRSLEHLEVSGVRGRHGLQEGRQVGDRERRGLHHGPGADQCRDDRGHELGVLGRRRRRVGGPVVAGRRIDVAGGRDQGSDECRRPPPYDGSASVRAPPNPSRPVAPVRTGHGCLSRPGSGRLSWSPDNYTRRSQPDEHPPPGRHPGPHRGGAGRPLARDGPRRRGRRGHPRGEAPRPPRRRRQGRRGHPRRRRRRDARGVAGARRVRRDGGDALHARGHLPGRRPSPDAAAPLAPQRRTASSRPPSPTGRP